MNRTRNRHVYERKGLDLQFVSTVLAPSPEAAVERAAQHPGKYVVIDLDFTTVVQVDVNLRAV